MSYLRKTPSPSPSSPFSLELLPGPGPARIAMPGHRRQPSEPTSPVPMDIAPTTPGMSSVASGVNGAYPFPASPSASRPPPVPLHVRNMAPFARARRPSLLSMAIERNNRQPNGSSDSNLSGGSGGNENGNGNSGGLLGGPAIIERRSRTYASFGASTPSLPLHGSSSGSSNSLLVDAAMMSPTSSLSNKDSGMGTPLDIDALKDSTEDNKNERGMLRPPVTPPRSNSEPNFTILDLFAKKGPLKPQRLLTLQSELSAPPAETETRSEAAFQRLLSSSSTLSHRLSTAGGPTVRSWAGRFPESAAVEDDEALAAGDGTSDSDDEVRSVMSHGAMSAGVGGGQGGLALGITDLMMLGQSASGSNYGEPSHPNGIDIPSNGAGMGMDVDMEQRSNFGSPRSSMSTPAHSWREPVSIVRPGKRKFEADRYDPYPQTKKRRGGSPFTQPRSPVTINAHPHHAHRYLASSSRPPSAHSSPVLRPSGGSMSMMMPLSLTGSTTASPGMSMYMAGAGYGASMGLGGGITTSPSLRPMARLPERALRAQRAIEGAEQGVDGLSLVNRER